MDGGKYIFALLLSNHVQPFVNMKNSNLIQIYCQHRFLKDHMRLLSLLKS